MPTYWCSILSAFLECSYLLSQKLRRTSLSRFQELIVGSVKS